MEQIPSNIETSDEKIIEYIYSDKVNQEVYVDNIEELKIN